MPRPAQRSETTAKVRRRPLRWARPGQNALTAKAQSHGMLVTRVTPRPILVPSSALTCAGR